MITLYLYTKYLYYINISVYYIRLHIIYIQASRLHLSVSVFLSVFLYLPRCAAAPLRLGSASSKSTKNPSRACAKARNGRDRPGILRLGCSTMEVLVLDKVAILSGEFQWGTCVQSQGLHRKIRVAPIGGNIGTWIGVWFTVGTILIYGHFMSFQWGKLAFDFDLFQNSSD